MSRAPAWSAALDGLIQDAAGKGDKGKELAAKASALKAALQQTDRKAIEKAAGEVAKAGGTLDTSATVVAAGALASDTAMKIGVIVKFAQNALIGVAALILVIWWTMKAGAAPGGAKPSASIIWERFPKFVLGFLVASALFSFFIPADMVSGTKFK